MALLMGFLTIRPIASALGADGELLENCVLYGSINLISLPAFICQYEFQCLFATAEKPTLGLGVTIAAGLTNIFLDAFFVAVLGWGLAGAAAATVMSEFVGGVIPLIYFARPNNSLLRLGKTKYNGRALGKTCVNGASELMSNISMSIVSMLYNIQLLRFAGEDGVAAYGVLMYVSMVFSAIFIGYSVGTAPVISFHYGAENYSELKDLRKKSMFLIGLFAVIMFASCYILSEPLSALFVGYDKGLLDLTIRAFTIYSFSFLFSGFAMFGSSFFTALNNGLVSAAISFLRTLVFQIAAVLILPLIWGVDGIWLSIVAAELMAVIITTVFMKVNQKKYRY